MKIRLATLSDIPALEALIHESVMVLQANDYTEAQRKGALGSVYGVDTQLIKDKTYFIVESDSMLVASGGWSKRKTLFGGDGVAGKNNQELDPKKDAARIRAFYVKPGWERRGIGTMILKNCEAAALKAGFKKCEIGATVTGVALYKAHGYAMSEQYDTPLSNGLGLTVVNMWKNFDNVI